MSKASNRRPPELMKKIVFISIVLLALTGGLTAATYWLSRERVPAWTTDSPAALDELRQGLSDFSKIYVADAAEHFQRALELDPDFTAAKLFLAKITETDRERWIAELEAADLQRLEPHERFLVAHWLARVEPERGDPEAILDDFLAKHPRDFFGLETRCHAYWYHHQQWDEAEACYRQLLELHPNWVRAHNALGYIAMARGRFDDAEEHFLTYRYVAPDQANPHDSLAELLVLLGRYEEAEASLQKAVRIKPDFCHAYELRAQIGFFSGRLEQVEAAIDDLGSIEACGALEDHGHLCSMRAMVRYFGGDAEGAWELFDGECLERHKGLDLIAHRVAVMTGRLERATELEELLRQRRAELGASETAKVAEFHTARLAHMEGVRHLAAGEYPRAVERLSEADALQGYWLGELASFKTYNRINLLRALELAGEPARAEALRRKISAVNPRILHELRLADLEAHQAG